MMVCKIEVAKVTRCSSFRDDKGAETWTATIVDDDDGGVFDVWSKENLSALEPDENGNARWFELRLAIRGSVRALPTGKKQSLQLKQFEASPLARTVTKVK